MTVEERRGSITGEDESSKDRFPVGMRVLAVDDDPTCLRLLESLLRRCKYHATTTSQAVTALKLLRENKNKFDLVISDVHMPDMDGFKLLELVGLEMDLPVIMMSANGDTNLVMKGITHGACDYLLKPIRIEELKNIWQHVIRRKKFDLKVHNNSDNQDKPHHGTEEDGGQGHIVTGNADRNGKLNRKRKDQDEDDDDEEEEEEENGHENEDPSSQKKPRVVWSVELHRKFVAAVNQLGIDKAVPKKILDLMNVDKLTRENVASHLQKYRLYLKRISCVASQQANMVAALGGNDSSYLRMNGLEGIGDFHALAGSRQSPNAALTSFTHSGMLGRLNSPSGLGLRGLPSSGIIQMGRTQNSSNSINDFGKLQQVVLPGNQNGSFLQGIPTSLALDQLQQSKCISRIGELSTPVNDPTVFPVVSGFLDSGVTIGSSSNSFLNVANNPLMLQGQAQQTQNRGGLGSQSSIGMASLNPDPFDIGVSVSSQVPDRTRCNDNWQSAIPLSGLPSNPLPLNDSFNHADLPPSNLRDNICSITPHTGSNMLDVSFTNAASMPLQDSRRDVQCQTGPIGSNVQHGNPKFSNFRSMSNNLDQNMSYAPKQRWEVDKQDYNRNSNLIFSSLNSSVPTHGFSLSQNLDQNNTVLSKKMDVTLIGQSNCGAPSLMQHNGVDTLMRLKEGYILEQTKSQDGYTSNSCGSLDDIMNAMIKQEQEMKMMEGDFGSDVFSLGTCL